MGAAALVRPPRRFPRTHAAALGAPVAALTAASLVGTAVAPALLGDHPLLLALLAPRSAFLVAAAAKTALPLFVVIGGLRLAAAGPSHFLLGRRVGPDVAARLGRGPAVARAVTGWAERLFRRIGVLAVVVSPTGKMLALAGASDVPTRRAATAHVAGILLRLLVFYAAAHSW